MSSSVVLSISCARLTVSGGPHCSASADYSIEENAYWSERVYSHVFRLLNEYGILMEGMLLKPNMCLPGDSPTDCADTSSIGQSLT